MKIASFGTNLTDAQWLMIEPLLPTPSRLGHPQTPLRPVVDAILYLIKSDCAWRLRASVRESEGKRCRPTAAALDSQTVRFTAHGGAVGYDPGKRTKGRKRFLLVDTLGMILGAALVPANETERSGAKVLLKPLLGWFPWLRKVWADSDYSRPEFAAWVREQHP